MVDSPKFEPTEGLLKNLNSLSIDDIPDAVIERARLLLLDIIGVSLLGTTYEWCKIVRDTLEQEGDKEESSVFGGSKVSARNAALINGTAAHGIGLDDIHEPSLSHPGCVIIPAAIAAGEAQDASGEEFLVAVIAGYEAQCRIGSFLGNALLRNGLHPPSHLGIFGATMTVSRIYGLTTEQLNCAFGLAGSMASGLMKFSEDPQGTMVKRLHAGMPAERAILAARLALRGFTGPRKVLSGESGYARAIARVEDISGIEQTIGDRYEIMNVSWKIYPCCKLFHTAIDAILECAADPTFRLEALQTIRVNGPAAMFKGHLERRPLSTVAGQYSLPYTMAVALSGRATQPGAYDEKEMQRADLLAISDKVETVVDPELEAYFPKQFAARVQLVMTGGLVIDKIVLETRGTPARPLSKKEVEVRFIQLTHGILDEARQEEIIEAVWSFDRWSRVRALASLLRA